MACTPEHSDQAIAVRILKFRYCIVNDVSHSSALLADIDLACSHTVFILSTLYLDRRSKKLSRSRSDTAFGQTDLSKQWRLIWAYTVCHLSSSSLGTSTGSKMD